VSAGGRAAAAGDWLEETQDGVCLRLRVQPKSSKCRLAGVHDGALKLRVTAPPVDGKANAAVVKFIAKILSVPKSAVAIVSGAQGRVKRVRVSGVGLSEARAAIAGHLT